MRQAHFLFPLGMAALLASFPMVHAQTINGQASFFHDTAWTAGALDPAAPSLPLRHPPLPPGGAIATELEGFYLRQHGEEKGRLIACALLEDLMEAGALKAELIIL